MKPNLSKESQIQLKMWVSVSVCVFERKSRPKKTSLKRFWRAKQKETKTKNRLDIYTYTRRNVVREASATKSSSMAGQFFVCWCFAFHLIHSHSCDFSQFVLFCFCAVTTALCMFFLLLTFCAVCILSSFFRGMEEKGEEGVFKFCVVRQECTQQSVVSKFGLLSAAHNHHNLIPTYTHKIEAREYADDF